MSMNTRGQINLTIHYVQSGFSSAVGVRYNLPGEGIPKGFQFCINIGFLETGTSTFLEAS